MCLPGSPVLRGTGVGMAPGKGQIPPFHFGAPRVDTPRPPPRLDTHCVRRVKAALVMEVGRLRPLVISRQIFLLMTSTRPPLSVTSR